MVDCSLGRFDDDLFVRGLESRLEVSSRTWDESPIAKVFFRYCVRLAECEYARKTGCRWVLELKIENLIDNCMNTQRGASKKKAGKMVRRR